MTTNASPTTRPLQRFASELGEMWPRLAPLCVDLGADDISALVGSTRRTAHRARPELRLLAGDLEALLAGWNHFDSDERALLRGTISYLEGEADAVGAGWRAAAGRDGRSDAGPARADDVVGAAVRTVLRG